MTHRVTMLCGTAVVAASVLLTSCGDERGDGGPAAPLGWEEAQALNNRGTVLMEQNHVEAALRVYRDLVAGAPKCREAWQNLAVCLLNAEHKDRAVRTARFDECERILERLVKEHPSFPNAVYTLGIVLEHRGREFPRVLELYGKAHELAPEDPDAAYRFGKALYEADEPDYERALALLERAVAAEAHFKSAWNALYPTLRRLGRAEDAEKAIETFKTYDRAKPDLGRTLKLSYDSMGTLADVVRELTPWEGLALPPAPKPVPISFERISNGFRVPPATATAEVAPWPDGETVPAGGDLRGFIEERVVPGLAPGIAVHDLDGDGAREVFIADGRARGRLYTERGGGLADVTDEWGLDRGPLAVGGVFGDVDHDGRPDLFVYGSGPDALFLNDGKGKLRYTPGCEGGDGVTAAAVMVDADHDGDLDILTAGYLAPQRGKAARDMVFPTDFEGAPNRLFNNNRPTIYEKEGDGSASFTDIGERAGLAGAERTADVAAFDFDRDGDLDVLQVNDRQPNRFHLNDRLWRYREVSATLGLDDAGPARGIALCDVDQDGRLDWFLSRGPSAATVLVRNRVPGPPAPEVAWARDLPERARSGLVFPADLDNDGDPDLVVCAEHAGETHVVRNDGGAFTPVTRLETRSPLRAVLPLHVDDDGLLDLAAPTPAHLYGLQSWRNTTASPWSWVVLALRGKRSLGLVDMWSNHFGVGASVEIASGSRRFHAENGIGGGRGVQPPPEVHVGIGAAEKMDYLRILWPDLVLQTEGDVAARRRREVEEINRKSSSCPVLYRRGDDGSFAFVTDFLGVGGLGFLLEPGAYAPPDETEVVRIGTIAERDGKLSLRVVEPMEEICYLDRLELVVVEHDEGVTVHADERLATAGPKPTGRPLAFRRRHRVRRAVNARGEDVTAALADKDRVHAGGLVPDRRFIGYLAEEQVLELELDRRALAADRAGSAQRLWCLVDGWVEYPYSHVNFAAWQAGVRGESISLDVEDADGEWRTAMPTFGYPAGMTRTMAVDVTDALASAPRRIRLRTNLDVHVDEIRLAWELPATALAVTRLDFDRAELRWLGYPQEASPDGRQPTIYDYDRIVEHMGWKAMGGRYTEYGDVRERLATADDRLVIMNHGEEIALDVDAGRLPPLPEGRARTFFLSAVGWCKDMDPYTATPDTVEPLPRLGMHHYPPTSPGRPGRDGGRELPATFPLLRRR